MLGPILGPASASPERSSIPSALCGLVTWIEVEATTGGAMGVIWNKRSISSK